MPPPLKPGRNPQSLGHEEIPFQAEPPSCVCRQHPLFFRLQQLLPQEESTFPKNETNPNKDGRIRASDSTPVTVKRRRTQSIR